MKSDDKFSKWEETRKKGFFNFLIKGTLNFSSSFALIFTIFQFVVPYFNPDLRLNNFFQIKNFLYFLINCLVMGVIWALILWFWLEISYKRHISKLKQK